ncbi:hypothetical protein [Serratia entomophila]|uniref:hypothetical protein n=1 Tax=Serratia entomophila TaxID=42906 RepID=UPI0021BB6EDB|nr:hypothetical protein [Serratia entomophila]
MDWDTFVYDNVRKQLIAEGFSEALAVVGGHHAADLYRRKSQASKKGSMYDDCLAMARKYVLGSCTKDEKPGSEKKKSRTVAAGRPSLF